MEDAVVEIYETIIRVDNIPVNMEVPMELQTLAEYLEGWQIKVWDYAYAETSRARMSLRSSGWQ